VLCVTTVYSRKLVCFEIGNWLWMIPWGRQFGCLTWTLTCPSGEMPRQVNVKWSSLSCSFAELHITKTTARFPFRTSDCWVCCLLNVFESQDHISILKYQPAIFVASDEQKSVFLKLTLSISSLWCSFRECGTHIFVCQVYCYRGIPFVSSCTYSVAIRILCWSNIRSYEEPHRIFVYTH
jgi:hypothetical protein